MEIEDKEEFKKALNRGDALVAETLCMNFLLLYGCKPSLGVKANTEMVKDILKAFTNNADRENAMVLLPQALDSL